MKEHIVIAGGTGLVGSRLIQLMDKTKYDITILTRGKSKSQNDIVHRQWSPTDGTFDLDITGVDHVINLAGAGIADARWTGNRKQILIQSRTKSTQLLASQLQTHQHALKTYIGASAIGYYGDRDDEILTENSEPGTGFMVECCQLWEEAHQLVVNHTESSTILRIGIVLSTKGGAFEKIYLPMKLGMANYFGNGKQYYSWIHIDDLCQMIISQLSPSQKNHEIWNAVAPKPLTNKDFIKQIKNGLQSRAIVAPAPAFALKLMLGEMSQVVLNSNRVMPNIPISKHFPYEYPNLPEAAQDIVARGI